MTTEVVKMDSINGATYNPRKKLKSGDAEYEALKNSIKNYGYLELIVVNKRNMTIIGGHQRFQVLKDMGIEEVEIVLIDVDEDEERLLNISLNKIKGDFDITMLFEEINTLQAGGTLLSDIGFSTSDVALVEDIVEDGIAITDVDTSESQLNVVSLSFGKYKIVFIQEEFDKFKEKLRAYVTKHGVSVKQAIIEILGGKK